MISHHMLMYVLDDLLSTSVPSLRSAGSHDTAVGDTGVLFVSECETLNTFLIMTVCEPFVAVTWKQ